MRWQAIPEKRKTLLLETALDVPKNRAQSFFSHTPLGEPRKRASAFGARAERNHARGSNALPAASRANDWSASLDSPRSDGMRTVGKARFVKKAKGYAISEPPFLIRSHVFCFHVLIASSSRSTARFSGF